MRASFASSYLPQKRAAQFNLRGSSRWRNSQQLTRQVSNKGGKMLGASVPNVDRRIDLIKADIQGEELGLIQGAKRTLGEDRPILCLELEPEVTGVERGLALFDELMTLGYKRMRLFIANESRPDLILRDLSSWLPLVAVQARIRAAQIGSYGTLWAEFGER